MSAGLYCPKSNLTIGHFKVVCILTIRQTVVSCFSSLHLSSNGVIGMHEHSCFYIVLALSQLTSTLPIQPQIIKGRRLDFLDINSLINVVHCLEQKVRLTSYESDVSLPNLPVKHNRVKTPTRFD